MLWGWFACLALWNVARRPRWADLEVFPARVAGPSPSPSVSIAPLLAGNNFLHWLHSFFGGPAGGAACFAGAGALACAGCRGTWTWLVGGTGTGYSKGAGHFANLQRPRSVSHVMASSRFVVAPARCGGFCLPTVHVLRVAISFVSRATLCRVILP